VLMWPARIAAPGHPGSGHPGSSYQPATPAGGARTPRESRPVATSLASTSRVPEALVTTTCSGEPVGRCDAGRAVGGTLAGAVGFGAAVGGRTGVALGTRGVGWGVGVREGTAVALAVGVGRAMVEGVAVGAALGVVAGAAAHPERRSTPTAPTAANPGR
jgi:hypothetical protein